MASVSQNPAIALRSAQGASRSGARPALTLDSIKLNGTTPLFLLYIAVILVEYLGLGVDLPILKAVRFSTLGIYFVGGMIFWRIGREALTGYTQNRLLGIFVLYTTLTVPIAVISMTAFEAWRTHVDYFVYFVITAFLVDRPERVRAMAILIAFMILFLVLRNWDVLTSASRAGGIQGAYFFGDGNDFGWGLNVLFPIAMYLVLSRQAFIWRMVGGAAVLAALLGIVGTQSRGASLALGAAGVFYWAFIARRKFLGLGLIAAVLAGILLFAPPEYLDRMRSIQNYQEDNSAQGRLQAWGAAVKMAVDFPLGVGANNFGSAYGRFYIPRGDSNALTWASGRWLSAHSVYFRLLGECGILGVIWIFVLLRANFRTNSETTARLAQLPRGTAIPPEWPLMLNMSLVGYAVAGVFLGGVSYPHMYMLCGFIVSAARLSLAAQNASATVTPPVGRPVRSLGPGTAVAVPSGVVNPNSMNVVDRARLAMSMRHGHR